MLRASAPIAGQPETQSDPDAEMEAVSEEVERAGMCPVLRPGLSPGLWRSREPDIAGGHAAPLAKGQSLVHADTPPGTLPGGIRRAREAQQPVIQRDRDARGFRSFSPSAGGFVPPIPLDGRLKSRPRPSGAMRGGYGPGGEDGNDRSSWMAGTTIRSPVSSSSKGPDVTHSSLRRGTLAAGAKRSYHARMSPADGAPTPDDRHRYADSSNRWAEVPLPAVPGASASSAREGSPVKLALFGYGRMGRAVEEVARARGHEVGPVLDELDNQGGQGITLASLAGARVAVDFSVAAAVPDNVREAARHGVNVVVGTTGWDAAREAVEDAVRSAGTAILTAPNFSIGMLLFERIVRAAACLADGVQGTRSVRRASVGDPPQEEDGPSERNRSPPGGAPRPRAGREEGLDEGPRGRCTCR